MFRRRRKPTRLEGVVFFIVGVIWVASGFTRRNPQYGVSGLVITMFGALAAFTAFLWSLLNSWSQPSPPLVRSDDPASWPEAVPREERLRQLEILREGELISDADYQRQREELRRESW